MVLVGINKILTGILKEKHTIAPKANAFGLSFGPARESPQHPKLSLSSILGVVEGGAWGMVARGKSTHENQCDFGSGAKGM